MDRQRHPPGRVLDELGIAFWRHELASLNICPGMGDLVKGKFVHEVHNGGGTRYFLGPPSDTTSDLADTISFIRFTSWASGWGRPAALVSAP